MDRRKIFGIGLSRMGTQILNECLGLLGYRSIQCPSPEIMNAGRFDEVLAEFGAATGLSVSAHFRELDAAYPGSRFILATQTLAEWLRSIEEDLRRESELNLVDCPNTKLRKVVYGTRVYDRAAYIIAYSRHVQNVRTYFAQRPDDLLEINLCAGEGWEKLCPFLGERIPDIEMPWPGRTRFAS